MNEFKIVASHLKLLANPSRLQIIDMLFKRGEMNVGDINKVVRISQPALSQHLAMLRKGGILKFRRDSREIYYSAKNMDITAVIETAYRSTITSGK